ncbi:MAG: SpoIIE family protein phosphatase [Gammaproteobacteria bacterium]|nr:SpoIIE family protein phosphatase [Gammaproteobacteria bacterium]
MVDDEEDLELLVRQRFRRRIRKGEYEFLFAHNGKEALEALDQNPDIRLVLSDINMPVMDGLTLLGQLEETKPDVKAVIISAYGDMENIRTAMNRGAFDFVTKPVDFNDLQITIEKTLKHINALEQALKNRDRLVAIRRELDVAKQVQLSGVPAELPVGDAFGVHAIMNPAKEIGGDFYDFFELDEHRLGLAIADVSDKGVPAALFTMITRALLKSSSRRHDSPSRCLHEVNEFLCQDNDACMFVTVFYGVLDLRDGSFRYSNGGHNPPRHLAAGGAVSELPLTGDFALGIADGHDFGENVVTVVPGDALFLYTDGITEACNHQLDEYGEQRLDGVLGGGAPMNAQELAELVVGSVERFVDGATQFDDITCLSLRLRSPSGSAGADGSQ